MLLGAPTALAEFVPTSFPSDGGVIAGFATSGSTWLALTAQGPGGQLAESLKISRDHGESWIDVPWPSEVISGSKTPQEAGVVVGPDGAFYVGSTLPSAPDGQYGRIIRVDPATAAVTTLPMVIPVQSGARMSPPAWDATGRIWVAYTNGSFSNCQITLARLADTGIPEFSFNAAAPAGPLAPSEITFLPSGTYVRTGAADAYSASSGATYKITGTTLTEAINGVPTMETGDVVMTSRSLSLDGGASWLDGGVTPTGWHQDGSDVVEGNPAFLYYGGRISHRYSAALWSGTGLTYPDKTVNRVIQTDAGLVAVYDQFKDQSVDSFGSNAVRYLGWHSGAVPDAPPSTGPISATLTGWLQRANQLRGTAGLPPLVGDPRISQASENHSRYWTLNSPDPTNPLSLHNETPGTPGYTGFAAFQRCDAVGATCGGEIMYGAGVTQPIDGWAASLYHRGLILNPKALVVGGAQVPGGPAVMNNGTDSGGLVVAPIMYPSGRYDGDLSFSGEVPDPRQACAQDGQPLTRAMGVVISIWVPGGDTSGFTLTPAGGAPMHGCTQLHSFIPDGSLQPGTTYTATVVWTPTPQLGPRTISWQFTTAGSAPGAGDSTGDGTSLPSPSCKPALSRPGRRVRRGKAIEIRYRACGPGRVNAGVYRLHPTRRQGRALIFKTAKVSRSKSAALRLATRRLRPGRYRLRGSLIAARGKTVSAIVVVTRRR
jgi:hypothetical protein